MGIFVVISILLISIGLVLFLKKINNYALIARNATYIHEILSAEFKDRFPDKNILFATAGVIDAFPYVLNDSLRVSYIKTGVLTSWCGACFLDLVRINITDNPVHHKMVRQADIVYFVYFVMQLEAMIFHVDTNISPENILYAIKSKKRFIEKEVIRTQRKYKKHGAPTRWKLATYKFMNSEEFAGLRDELGITRPTLDDLFRELVNREHWSDIQPDIIQSIFTNANGNLESVQNFIFISERYNLVQSSFVHLAESFDMEYGLLLMFSGTLYSLGSNLVKSLASAKTEDEAKLLAMYAGMAFTSGILCAPYSLCAYYGMAILYGCVWINKDIALEFCRKYKEVEDKLMSTPDEDLSSSELLAKQINNGEKEREFHSFIAERCADLTHLLPDDWEEESRRSMRDIINDLENKLLNDQRGQCETPLDR
jgi:hypothetical protein